MARVRKPLKSRQEGAVQVARFLHPLTKRTVRCNLGVGNDAVENLRQLNGIFMGGRDAWKTLPEGLSKEVREAWTGDGASVAAKGDRVSDGGEEHPVDEAELAGALADNRRLKDDNAELRAENKRLRHQLEEAIGHKVRVGPSPTLRAAADIWLATLKEKRRLKDADHTRVIAVTVNLFVKEFGPTREVDDLVGKEDEIDSWLQNRKIKGGENDGKAISATRRAAIRRIVLRFLRGVGVRIDRERVTPVTAKELREGRGAIRWLEKKDAEKLAEKLPEYWQDIFRLQTATGLRPSETITLKRGDFSKTFDKLTLSPLNRLTLKTGSRTIRVPVVVRSILKRRFKNAEVCFADPANGGAWECSEDFEAAYRKVLDNARTEAKIKMKVDCRTGRRTCGSLLLRSGMSIEQVSACLGNSPDVCREHYARLLAVEVDPSAAALEA